MFHLALLVLLRLGLLTCIYYGHELYMDPLIRVYEFLYRSL